MGIDDFSFRKGQNYGIIIVDEENHSTIALLEGRDGESLRQWLQENKHVTTVTRDRSSAYSKVLREELPHAIQVADRFHLHHNFMEAVKKALHEGLPNQISIKIPLEMTENDKIKENSFVENSPELQVTKKEPQERGKQTKFFKIELIRKELIHNIQELHQKGDSERSISFILNKSRATVRKYSKGDPALLCLSTKQGNRARVHSLESYEDITLKCIGEGMKTSAILELLKENYRYCGASSTFRKYFSEFLHLNGLKKRGSKSDKTLDLIVRKEKVITVSHREILQYLWTSTDFKEDISEKLFEIHPYLYKIKKFIMEFRYIFNHKCQARLYLFIESCKKIFYKSSK